MSIELEINMLPQPDDDTCGPTCLHALYAFYGDDLPLTDVIDQIQRLENRGTLAVYLANHALRRGYRATIYTYNLRVFDPTWFQVEGTDFPAKLRAQMEAVSKPRLHTSSRAYLEYFDLGGRVLFEDLTADLIRGFIARGRPILTGLSATYLYRTAREYGPHDDYDDIRGKPSGHFVVLCGYHSRRRLVTVADPLATNPRFPSRKYRISIERVVGAVLLGILSYDGNLLIIEPPERAKPGREGRSARPARLARPGERIGRSRGRRE